MNASDVPAGPPREALCKRVMAVLAPYPQPSEALWPGLESVFGPIDFKGPFLPFDTTDYYRDEFGPGLHRGFISFRGLASPEGLPGLKHDAARLEAAMAKEGKRFYNLDIGYMDSDKLVLASFKRGPCKLYLTHGVYADLLIKYAKGRFEPFPWAFADFQDGRYQKSLLTIREKLKSELRKSREEASGESD
ncbi:MAG: GTP-binding protein [Fibrobacteres bacterium]|nr:GTP-binding protein [Fibrobacterota bacterium]